MVAIVAAVSVSFRVLVVLDLYNSTDPADVMSALLTYVTPSHTDEVLPIWNNIRKFVAVVAPYHQLSVFIVWNYM